MDTRRRALFLLGLAALSTGPATARAAGQPDRKITLVVPFSAGGGVDAIARLLAEKLRESLQQPVIVENRPGASGMLGAAFVAKAPADGRTLLLGSAGETAINPLVYKDRMQYQPARDFAPVSLVVKVPNVLVVHPALPVGNLAELIAYARKHPGKLSYATSGVGNPQHLNGALLESLAGIRMQHVPHKGASGQLVDVAAGTVDISFVSYAGAAPFIKGGRLKPLAVSSTKRASFAPSIPTLAETVPGYDLENWFGLFAPAATPADTLARLGTAVQDALRDPALAQRLQEQGGEPAPLAAEPFRRFIQAQARLYERIVEAGEIVAE